MTQVKLENVMMTTGETASWWQATEVVWARDDGGLNNKWLSHKGG